MALEVVYALTFFKPLLEVLRIARGEKQKPYQSLSPLSENNFGKGIEVFTESGPTVVRGRSTYRSRWMRSSVPS
jgi:hypothetical protein